MSQTAQKFLTRLENEVIRFAPCAVLVFDDQNVIRIANSKAFQLLEDRFEPTTQMPQLAGRTLESLFPGLNFSDVGSEWLHLIRSEDDYQPLELQCVQVEHEGLDWVIAYLDHPNSQRQREMLLEKEACTDALSGLANRRAFQRTMESNHHRSLSLAIVDIDRFKEVNDQHGHLAGDDLIQYVSGELLDSFQDNSILISRMGGDEFSVLFETKDSELIVESLDLFREKISNGQLPQQTDLEFSVSIGAAISTQAATSSRTLLTQADKQLYEAKNQGRDQVSHVFLEGSENDH